jgi:hypothetical protein
MKPIDLKHELSHVFWIGGATDSGKSTVAQILANRHHLQVYHYDQRDLAHMEILAETHPDCRAYLTASLDELWVVPEPEVMFQRLLPVFHYRLSLMIEDIMELPRQPRVIAEGFGLLPELLAPLLTRPTQAVWLYPTDDFKESSLTRRNKPSFASQVSDPARARQNLLRRDRLLTRYIRDQVRTYGFTGYEIDGNRSAEEIAEIVGRWFLLSNV